MGVSVVLTAYLLAVPIDLARLSLDLQAIKETSPRPRECAEASPASGWQRAGNAEITQYCLALAKGYASLREEPKLALEQARLLEPKHPRRLEARVLEARALVTLGQFEAALAVFLEVERDAPRLLRGAEVTLAMARAAAKVGNGRVADGAYRSLVPQSGLLSRAVDQRQVFLEAALAALAVGEGDAPRVLAYLDEARRAHPAGRLDTLTSLVSALLELARGDRVAAKRWVEGFELPLWLTLEEGPEAQFEVDETTRTASVAFVVPEEQSEMPWLPQGARVALAATWYELAARGPEAAYSSLAWQMLLEGAAGEGWKRVAERVRR